MIKFGNKGPEVAKIQKILSSLGYDLIVDADFGNKTFESIKDFQKKQGFIEDGIVGEKTMTALMLVEEKINNYETPNIITKFSLNENQYIKQVFEKTQIFLHFTSGRSSAKDTISYWNNDTPQIATAYVIDGDTGEIYQAFSPDYFGWHLGIKGTNGKLDKASIGIEICAFGPLVKKNEKFYAWPNDYSSVIIDPKHVYELKTPFR